MNLWWGLGRLQRLFPRQWGKLDVIEGVFLTHQMGEDRSDAEERLYGMDAGLSYTPAANFSVLGRFSTTTYVRVEAVRAFCVDNAGAATARADVLFGLCTGPRGAWSWTGGAPSGGTRRAGVFGAQGASELALLEIGHVPALPSGEFVNSPPGDVDAQPGNIPLYLEPGQELLLFVATNRVAATPTTAIMQFWWRELHD